MIVDGSRHSDTGALGNGQDTGNIVDFPVGGLEEFGPWVEGGTDFLELLNGLRWTQITLVEDYQICRFRLADQQIRDTVLFVLL